MGMLALPTASSVGLYNALKDGANRVYQQFPSAETAISASIAVGAGIATGGVGGAVAALGYCVAATQSGKLVHFLEKKATEQLPENLKQSQGVNFAIQAASTLTHGAVIGLTSPAGIAYGTVKATAGLAAGQIAVKASDAVMEELQFDKDGYVRRGANMAAGALGGYAASQAVDGVANYINSRLPENYTPTNMEQEVVIDDGDQFYDAPEAPQVKQHVESLNLKGGLMPNRMAARDLLSLGDDIPEPTPPTQNCPANRTIIVFPQGSSRTIDGTDGYCGVVELDDTASTFFGCQDSSAERAQLTLKSGYLSLNGNSAQSAKVHIILNGSAPVGTSYRIQAGNNAGQKGYFLIENTGGETTGVSALSKTLESATVVAINNDNTGVTFNGNSGTKSSLYAKNSRANGSKISN
ncbi:hypothetical protein D5018_20710 [Parashewanella curva]|uniref:DUF637 domain-containing protein n=1 Tax=Parashewanella curva TaxID=2338552 RepID=A0A3L8PR07_9GAMM|nr:hypothetical protein [Parashewanella curva]RLV57786.1 hypothetical protein D5018_20710 [Parashewanella curva]